MNPTISVDYIGGWYDGPLDFVGHIDSTSEQIVGYIRNDWDEEDGTERDFFVYKHVYKVDKEGEIKGNMVFLGIFTYDEIENWPKRFRL